MRRIFSIICIAVSASLVGCAMPGVYNYVPTTKSDSATVKAKGSRESISVGESFLFASIDGEIVNLGMFTSPLDAIIQVEPGVHIFVIDVKFSKGWRKNYDAIIPMKANLRAGANYQLMGEITWEEARVWLQDIATQEIVSEPAASQWGTARNNRPIGPIIIRDR